MNLNFVSSHTNEALPVTISIIHAPSEGGSVREGLDIIISANGDYHGVLISISFHLISESSFPYPV